MTENENQRLKGDLEAMQKSIDYYSDLSQQWQEKYEAASKEKTYYVDTDPDQMDTTEAIKAVKLLKEENERLKGELDTASSFASASIKTLTDENEAWNEWYDDLRCDFQGVTDNPHDSSRMHDWDFIDQHRPSPALPKDYFERKAEKSQAEEKVAIEELQDINDKLEAENCSLRERVNTVEDLQSRLSKANERIEFLENDAKNQSALSKAGEAWAEEDYKKLQAELSKAKSENNFLRSENESYRARDSRAIDRTLEPLVARIKELETPSFYRGAHGDAATYTGLLSHEEVRYVQPIKLLPCKYGFAVVKETPEDPNHHTFIEGRLFNTLEEAQQAIEGEE